MVDLRRGDIVLCDLNPVKGTEQAGIRPVIIVQIDQANKVSPHTIIVPLTSKIRTIILASHVFVPANTGGLKEDSVILCEQIRVIDKSRINKIIGHLEDDFILKLEQAYPQF
ncbi:type II toxin-antitoxin system PemK/MazF family toxin [Geminocystis sp. GBBB08]|uniref:type II toxin-antitoxin system PemK/MazF family toxin n=1 Tax=Geminocystis sp. GBBB08 TaxID=2604140 RepID=UPI0027E36961|nr:type II toxin-antitoxin system PemK/MazF family toxin [Geminocystis sp. GBBB08]MBL1210818.1 type II toxin-antitoxin system PemK/MazF family toxin [Geminocystis sp. GBBB08]